MQQLLGSSPHLQLRNRHLDGVSLEGPAALLGALRPRARLQRLPGQHGSMGA